MWTIFKVFIEFVTVLLLFHVWVCGVFFFFFGHKASTPHALECEVLTIGLSGKSILQFHTAVRLKTVFYYIYFIVFSLGMSILLPIMSHQYNWYLDYIFHCCNHLVLLLSMCPKMVEIQFLLPFVLSHMFIPSDQYYVDFSVGVYLKV